MWGYLMSLYDLRSTKTKVVRTSDGRVFRNERSRNKSSDITVGEKEMYGYVQPWPEKLDPDDPEHQVIAMFQEKPGLSAGLDYYVALSEGTRNGRPLISTGIKATAFYPERLFMWGECDKHQPLPRYELLRHAQAIGLRGTPAFWDTCQVWRGYSEGLPTFHTALRGCADMGPRWHDAIRTLSGKLPAGYQWSLMPGCSYGTLYWEEASIKP